MAYNAQNDRNWRNIPNAEEDDDLPGEDYDIDAEDEEKDEELARPSSAQRSSGGDVHEGEYRVLREDAPYTPRPGTALRSAAAPSRQRTTSQSSYADPYAASDYPTSGGAINSAYGAGPTRGVGGSNQAVIRVPRSVPWLSIGCFGILAAVAIVLVVLAISLSNTVGGIGGFFGGLFGGGKNTYQVDTSSSAVVQQMQGLNRMESAKYTIEKVIVGYQKSDLDFLYGGKVLFVAHADVTAGIDMSKLQEGDISLSKSVTGTQEVSVQLPKAEIFATTLDESKSYVYSADTNSIFGRLDPKIFDMVRSSAQEEITKAAQEQGIIEMADKNARTNVELFLRRLGFTSIKFK